MSLSQIFSRFRKWLPFVTEQRKLKQLKNEIEGKSKKRKPFKTTVELPWYSMNRSRNMLLLVFAAVGWMFWHPICNFKRAVHYGNNLERERRKFLKELDEEDRLFEEKLAAEST